MNGNRGKFMKPHMKLTIRTQHPAARIACGFMGISAAVRLWHYLAEPLTWNIFLLHLLLPISAAVLFICGILTGERYVRPLTVTAVSLGVTFFLLKAVSFALLHRILCTVLYFAVQILYVLTVEGFLPTKKLLYPLFGLPLLYHIFVEDMQIYILADPPVPIWDWMPEISVLCIMAALFSLVFAMKTEKITSEK